MQIADYEKQLEVLEKKKNAIIAKQKNVKAKMSKEKRAKENHTKMVLGGAVFGVLKDYHLPTDRKELDIYGRAVKAVFKKYESKLVEMIDSEYEKLKREQPSQTPASYLPPEDYEDENCTITYRQNEE